MSVTATTSVAGASVGDRAVSGAPVTGVSGIAVDAAFGVAVAGMEVGTAVPGTGTAVVCAATTGGGVGGAVVSGTNVIENDIIGVAVSGAVVGSAGGVGVSGASVGGAGAPVPVAGVCGVTVSGAAVGGGSPGASVAGAVVDLLSYTSAPWLIPRYTKSPPTATAALAVYDIDKDCNSTRFEGVDEGYVTSNTFTSSTSPLDMKARGGLCAMPISSQLGQAYVDIKYPVKSKKENSPEYVTKICPSEYVMPLASWVVADSTNFVRSGAIGSATSYMKSPDWSHKIKSCCVASTTATSTHRDISATAFTNTGAPFTVTSYIPKTDLLATSSVHVYTWFPIVAIALQFFDRASAGEFPKKVGVVGSDTSVSYRDPDVPQVYTVRTLLRA